MPNLTQYVWDSELRLYRRKTTDDIVSESEMDEYIDSVLAALALLWQERASAYLAGSITFDEFFTDTRSEIESMNFAMTALAFGGVKIATDYDYRRMQSLIQDQINYFYNFAIAIRAEKLSEAMILARLNLYALAGYGHYQNSKTIREVDAGMSIYRRNLGVADHCEDCVEYASRGWQMIGTLPIIGASVCKARCHCWFQFSNDLTLLGAAAPLPTLKP